LTKEKKKKQKEKKINTLHILFLISFILVVNNANLKEAFVELRVIKPCLRFIDI